MQNELQNLPDPDDVLRWKLYITSSCECTCVWTSMLLVCLLCLDTGCVIV